MKNRELGEYPQPRAGLRRMPQGARCVEVSIVNENKKIAMAHGVHHRLRSAAAQSGCSSDSL